MRYEKELLQLHNHICPRQVLGVRMGELAGDLFGLPLPQTNKRLLVFVETDGCFADGVMVATGCSLGHRTLRLVDQGKVAATFVDTRSTTNPQRAVRIHPHPLARRRALDAYARQHPNGTYSRWQAQFDSYQSMPVEELLSVQNVELTVSSAFLISRPGVRAVCSACGEEIINEREVRSDGLVLCRHCAGESYYQCVGGTNGVNE